MKTKLLTQIIISLVLLFGLGGLCGYAMSARMHAERSSQKQGEQWARRWIDQRMAQDFALLKATPEQQAALRPSYEQLLSDFNAIQAEASAKVSESFKRHRTEVREQLTPQQREIFRQSHQERISRRATNAHPSGKP